ncbi:phosphoadenosine phosphosulfate reductase family protein [Anabaena azotica]|uniref:Phosphoadenosine phosphosulfate reductase family protein n=1 Tax=Anabaena azotica FACHB-119 TaxID=947527 RepID=A0ABR8D9K3_9NOST|nr:phosphoadenosine phosphosulfate reductase family protein [Anabaena azotica]MBD2503883.1 phosphoadenosine phosphosulfate reductase family protein [Anabaena azotica FACHB-119]
MKAIQLALDLGIEFQEIITKFDINRIIDYDYIIISFSGGKDSLACLLYILELIKKFNISKDKVECWHHLVDGNTEDNFFDYPITSDYCKKVCEALGVKLYFSWREGGIKREMLRVNDITAPVFYETPDGIKSSGGKSKSFNTRLRFPQKGNKMKTRWCSSVVKIAVGYSAIAGQDRFKGKKTLFITGERREESAARAEYEEFKSHETNAKCRHVDHWRAILDWRESQVWEIIKRQGIRPHPSYELGFPRCSCINCIFINDHQLASVNLIASSVVSEMAKYEKEFNDHWINQGKEGYTIDPDRRTVMERVATGQPYNMRPEIVRLALSHKYYESVIVSSEEWRLPPGAFSKENGGPT